MKNPIKVINSRIKLGQAMAAVANIKNNPDYESPPNEQKFIELADVHAGSSNNLHAGSSHYETFKDPEKYSEFLERKRTGIIENVVSLVEQGKISVAEHSLELLSQYYGLPLTSYGSSNKSYPSRQGGVPEKLDEAMVAYNDTVGEGGTLIPQSVIDKVTELRETQLNWANKERRERVVEAVRTFHLRYPDDFLNEFYTGTEKSGAPERQGAIDRLVYDGQV